MFQIKATSDDNYQGCIRCQMHFNSGKKPGTQEQSQLPAQWVEITGDFAGIWESEYIKPRQKQ